MRCVAPASEISAFFILNEAGWAKAKPNFVLLEVYQDVFNLRGAPLSGRNTFLLCIN